MANGCERPPFRSLGSVTSARCARITRSCQSIHSSYSDFGACRDDLDGDRTDQSLADIEVPPSGESFVYFITADDTPGAGGAEGSLGAGDCAERSNFAACP